MEKNIKQKEQVIEAMQKNGGFATFQKLNEMLDFSTWKTKTPAASVRRIVQQNKEFYKIKPGLWALKEYKKELSKNNIEKFVEKETEKTHAYYQRLIVEIGNIRKFNTFVPNQDKNKFFDNRKLNEITTLSEIPSFTYDELLKKAKTIDVIWFNERKLPNALYEVEHTTTFDNSLEKFYDLQDFHTHFRIVASEKREKEYISKINKLIYKDIKNRIEFIKYEKLEKQFEVEFVERVI